MSDTKSMPYAPPSAIRSVIDRFRDAGLPSPLTVESITRVGVSESIAPRTIQGLRILNLIDEAGQPTPQFETMRRASTPEFPQVLADWLHGVYADVFSVAPPSGNTYEAVRDAFRGFDPAGQRDRMVSLFLGLCEYAGFPELPTSRGKIIGQAKPPLKRLADARRQAATPRPHVPHAPSAPFAPFAPTGAVEPGHRTTIDLGDAGTVALVVNVNPLAFTSQQREWFYRVVDAVNEQRSAQPGTTAVDEGAGL